MPAGGSGGLGAIPAGQLQALTSRLGSMNLNANDLSSMGHALGLNEQQISQIQQNIQASQQPAVPGMFSQQPASYLPPPFPSNAPVPSAAWCSADAGIDD